MKDIISLPHCGTFVMNGRERGCLLGLQGGQFEKHPKYEGVETKLAYLMFIPQDILRIISEAGCVVTDFFVIKAENGVPMHEHNVKKGRELYFGGSGGCVTILGSDKELVGSFDMDENIFTTIYIGEWHGVECAQPVTFFGIKYDMR